LVDAVVEAAKAWHGKPGIKDDWALEDAVRKLNAFDATHDEAPLT